MYYGFGLIGLLLFILEIVAIIAVLQSSMPSVNKLIWVLVILFFPLIGVLLWFLIGNKRLS